MNDYSTLALTFVGIKQGSKQHKYIIDWYNDKCKPLARGYKVKYSDSWCATFVSTILNMGGAINPPYECSVYYMWKLAEQKKQIVKNPKINDIIVYDWGANGTYDHVGFIYKIISDNLYVVEGNKNKQVGTRIINKNNKEIRGYIRVKNTSNSATNYKHFNDSLVYRVIGGDYGNGDYRKRKLTEEGYNYEEVQKAVNNYFAKHKNNSN